MRNQVANFVNNALPPVPYAGPPLPIGLKIFWPDKWKYNSVTEPLWKVLSKVSNPMVDAKYKLVKTIEGH